MSVGTPYLIAPTGGDRVSSSSASLTTNVALNAGDTAFIGVAGNANITLSSITNATADEVQSSTSSAMSVSVGRCGLGGAGLASGTALTLNFSAAVTAKCYFAFGVPGLALASVDQVGAASNSTGTPTVSTSAAQTDADAIALGFFGHNPTAGGGTGTPGGSYTELIDAFTGITSPNITNIYVEYLILTSTGTQTATYTPTQVTTVPWAGLLLVSDGSGGGGGGGATSPASLKRLRCHL